VLCRWTAFRNHCFIVTVKYFGSSDSYLNLGHPVIRWSGAMFCMCSHYSHVVIRTVRKLSSIIEYTKQRELKYTYNHMKSPLQGQRVSQARNKHEAGSLYHSGFLIRLLFNHKLKMEAPCSCETLVDFHQTTQCYIPQYRTLHNQRCKNFNHTPLL
jgi:hypothetical protein